MVIDCSNTDEIICPYCGYEEMDSWEHRDSGEIQCGECDKKFNFEIEHSVSYSSGKISCKDDKHDFELSNKSEDKDEFTCHSFIKNSEGYGDKKTMREEKDFEYIEVWKCKNCDEEEFRNITKEQYIERYPETYKLNMEWYERDKSRFANQKSSEVKE